MRVSRAQFARIIEKDRSVVEDGIRRKWIPICKNGSPESHGGADTTAAGTGIRASEALGTQKHVTDSLTQHLVVRPRYSR